MSLFDQFKIFFDEKVLPEWIIAFEKLEKILKDYDNSLDIFDEKLYLDKTVFIRDPLWGEITLNKLERDLLDSFFLQRLRMISQMGGTKFVYPSANHKRFDHSLGTFGVVSNILNEKILKRRNKGYEIKLAAIKKSYCEIGSQSKKLADLLEEGAATPAGKSSADDVKNPKTERMRNWFIQNLKISMLLHDIGHFPFSHAFELLMKRNQTKVCLYRTTWAGQDPNDATKSNFPSSPHETRTRDIILGNDQVINEFIQNKKSIIKDQFDRLHLDAELIAKSISGETSFCLSNLINGSLDADKMDYLARDNYFSMAPNYLMIFDRIYRLAEFQPCGAEGKITMVFSEKAISAIMKIILSRTFEYNDIINHPVQLCFQGLFFACIEKIMDHHAPEEQSDILKRLELMNDDQLLHALSILGDGDQLIQNLLYAIKYRELYKKAEIYTKTEMQEVITLLGKSEAESIFLDHYNIEHFLKDFEQDSPDLKDFVNLAKELQNTNSGILFFYNKDNPAFHKILQKVLIIKESDGNIMSLKDYLHDKAKGNGKFINNPSTRDDDIDTALSILDIFNVIDDRCYIYCDKRVIGHVQTVLKKFFNHGGVSNFLLYCIKDSIDTTSAK